MIIAIDGPAGSGKSTISKLIAENLGITYLDTGAMYRLFTLKLLKEKVLLTDKDKINKFLENLDIDITNDRFYLDGENVSEEIRKTDISENVSKVAAIKEVREKMVDLQRKFSKSQDVIMDGRDIGTVVFPNADIKIFLVADLKERAERRYKEIIEKGQKVSFDEIYENIVNRDNLDSTREITPLRKAEDAIEIDTTGKSIEKVKNEILEICRNRNKL
ncbi:(d)CMP kinase [Leptotrichia sp. OH3620_COT-345]|uniref:(d)CMP kinase n=1 Tax=Leptotrichia sp. OH3620_COT-345 TaxID=2491048 RepID=UPI000F655C17|nr:(d)CMP kinase [Leptotrichia sp. OH3620_COT-345]RRD38970.1 (d)CMP kinase [Leptotrichia sp. OH3620_COT-345]